MKRFAPLALLLMLGACSTTPTAGKVDPAQTVYGLEGIFTTSVQVATTYAQLPRCGVTAPLLCSDQDTVTRIQAAATLGAAALTSAQSAVQPGSGASAASIDASVASAVAAGTSLQSLVSTVKTK